MNTAIVVTKERMIRSVAEDTNVSLTDVRLIYNALEEKLREYLEGAKPEQNIIVKLFEGISVESKYVPEQEKRNNLTGEVIVAKSKIKPKAIITRNYCDKITNHK